MLSEILNKNRQVLLYGACLAGLVFVLKWLEMRLLIIKQSMEMYTGGIALLFTGLGIWLAVKLARPKVKTITLEKEVPVAVMVPAGEFVQNGREVERLGLSRRELEVLQLMSNGHSNQEIAEQLFVSLNTIKTHSANLYQKLDVKRRTQAVEKAKKTGIIP